MRRSFLFGLAILTVALGSASEFWSYSARAATLSTADSLARVVVRVRETHSIASPGEVPGLPLIIKAARAPVRVARSPRDAGSSGPSGDGSIVPCIGALCVPSLPAPDLGKLLDDAHRRACPEFHQ